MTISNINQLPNKALYYIFNYISFEDLTNNCKEVCQRWEAIVLYILEEGNRINRWKLPVPLLPSKHRFMLSSYWSAPTPKKNILKRTRRFYIPYGSTLHNELINKLTSNRVSDLTSKDGGLK